MDISIALDYSPPILGVLLVGGAVACAWLIGRKSPAVDHCFRIRTWVLCTLHLAIAGFVFWDLATHGWLAETYHWDDPSDANLVIAIFEVLCVVAVAALIFTRRAFFHRLVVNFMLVQIFVGVAVSTLLLLFVLTWKPRLF